MDASLFDLVGAYYANMSAKDIQKAGAHYLDPVWPVHPVIKYLLLFRALEKLHKEGKKNLRLRLMARAADKKAKAHMSALIGELAALANQTPAKTAQALIESCFCQTQAGTPYVFAHYLKGVQSAFVKAEKIPAHALSRAVLIMDGCDGKILLSDDFLGYLCAVSIKHKYTQAAAFFLKKLQNRAGKDMVSVLTKYAVDKKILHACAVTGLGKKRSSGQFKRILQHLR